MTLETVITQLVATLAVIGVTLPVTIKAMGKRLERKTEGLLKAVTSDRVAPLEALVAEASTDAKVRSNTKITVTDGSLWSELRKLGFREAQWAEHENAVRAAAGNILVTTQTTSNAFP